MKRNKTVTGLAAGMATLIFAAGLAQAAVSYTAFSNGSNADISSNNIYTHKLDFGAEAAATVNGVVFTQLDKVLNATSVSTPNFTFSVAVPTGGTGSPIVGSAAGGGSGGFSTSTNIGKLMNDMIYAQFSTGPVNTTMTLTGLTAGTAYSLRVYTQGWGAADRNATFNFTSNGSTETTGVINQNNATPVNPGWQTPAPYTTTPYYINYEYVAGADGTATVDIIQTSLNGTWHVYGLTNQVVIPEPSAALLAFGGLGMAVVRRKRC